jgi:hypothetical protein
MNKLNRTLHALVIILLATITGFAQDTRKTEKKNDEQQEPSRKDGLKRITPARHWDYDIDEDAMEANIERAVENAMKSVDVALGKMEINLKHLDIEPINIHIPEINIEPVEVNIPEINIPPIEVNIPQFNFDFKTNFNHHFRHHFNSDNDDDNDKSDKQDKSKGLKKIN